jgi:hypothetical protein
LSSWQYVQMVSWQLRRAVGCQDGSEIDVVGSAIGVVGRTGVAVNIIDGASGRTKVSSKQTIQTELTETLSVSVFHETKLNFWFVLVFRNHFETKRNKEIDVLVTNRN